MKIFWKLTLKEKNKHYEQFISFYPVWKDTAFVRVVRKFQAISFNGFVVMMIHVTSWWNFFLYFFVKIEIQRNIRKNSSFHNILWNVNQSNVFRVINLISVLILGGYACLTNVSNKIIFSTPNLCLWGLYYMLICIKYKDKERKTSRNLGPPTPFKVFKIIIRTLVN